MNKHFHGKAAVPRQSKNADSLKESLSAWIDNRLLSVASSNIDNLYDKYRIDYLNSHKKYAALVKIVVDYVAEKEVMSAAHDILSNLEIEFSNPLSNGQKDAAGICGAELSKIIEIFKSKQETTT